MLKKIYDQLLKKSSSPKASCQPKLQPDVLAAFFKELHLYRPALIRALTGLIGEQACLQVFKRLDAMDGQGSQLNKTSSANALNFIRNWHHKNHYQDSFSIHFMTSVSHISTDKWSFLGKAED